MQLQIRQRVFSWTDSYDVYDEDGTVRYTVKAEFLSLTGHRLHVFDPDGSEVGLIREKLFSVLPSFEIEVDGVPRGYIAKKFSFLHPRYEVDYNSWRVEGDFLGWEYDVYNECCPVVHISRQLLSFGDTYTIDFADPRDELMGLLLVIAIDAANCTGKD